MACSLERSSSSCQRDEPKHVVCVLAPFLGRRSRVDAEHASERGCPASIELYGKV